MQRQVQVVLDRIIRRVEAKHAAALRREQTRTLVGHMLGTGFGRLC